jgi:hypothetical protein
MRTAALISKVNTELSNIRSISLILPSGTDMMSDTNWSAYRSIFVYVCVHACVRMCRHFSLFVVHKWLTGEQ